MANPRPKQPRAPRPALSTEDKLRRQLRNYKRTCWSLVAGMTAGLVLFWLQGPASIAYIETYQGSASNNIQRLTVSAYEMTSSISSIKLYLAVLAALAVLGLLIYFAFHGATAGSQPKKRVPATVPLRADIFEDDQ